VWISSKKRPDLFSRVVSIQIRILGSVPLDYGSGSCSFLQWLSKCQQKLSVFKVFCLLLTVGTISSIFKDKVIKKSQNCGNQGFSKFLCLMMEGSGIISEQKKITDPDSDHPKNFRILRIRIRNTALSLSVSEAFYIFSLTYGDSVLIKKETLKLIFLSHILAFILQKYF